MHWTRVMELFDLSEYQQSSIGLWELDQCSGWWMFLSLYAFSSGKIRPILGAPEVFNQKNPYGALEA